MAPCPARSPAFMVLIVQDKRYLNDLRHLSVKKSYANMFYVFWNKFNNDGLGVAYQT